MISVQFKQQLEEERELRRAKEETVKTLQGDDKAFKMCLQPLSPEPMR